MIVYDHVLGAVPERFTGAQIGFQQPPYTDRSPFHDVFVLLGYLREAGRDAASLSIEGRMRLSIGGAREWAERAEEWRAIGATHLSVNTMNAGLSSPREHLDAALRWKEAVAGSP